MSVYETMRDKRLRAKAAGICTACCTRPVAEGRGSCAICFERRRRGYAKQAEKRNRHL